MNKSTLFYFFIILLITTTKVNGVRRVGGKTQVKDVKTNKEVQGLGKFSVEEYNKKLQETPSTPRRTPIIDALGHDGGPNQPLKFIEVVEAQTQVVSGIKYYLKVEAMENGVIRNFDSVVVIKPWIKSKQLLNFGPSTK